jgi:DNA-binding NtrC family response regulator
MSHWSLDPVACSSFEQARGFLPDDSLLLIFCQDKLPDGSFAELLQNTAKQKTRIVVICSTPDVEELYSEAIRLGAFDVIATPCRKSDVQWMVIRAIQEENRRGGNKRRSKTVQGALATDSSSVESEETQKETPGTSH